MAAYKAIRFVITAAMALVVGPVVGGFFIALAEENHWYQHPTERLGAIMKWLTELPNNQLLVAFAIFMFGLTVGIWADSWMRKIIRRRGSIELAHGARVKLFVQGSSPQEITNENVWRWAISPLVGFDGTTPGKIFGHFVYVSFDKPINSLYYLFSCSKEGIHVKMMDYTSRYAVMNIEGDATGAIIEFKFSDRAIT